MQLSNKWYDILKPVALYVLPALATLYGALAQVWALPYVTQIVGTIMLIDTVLGGVLKISKTQYDAQMKNAQGFIYANQPTLPLVDPNMPKWYIPKTIYDKLMWVAQILLPSMSSAYFGLAAIWGFLYPEQVVASIAAVDTFLGVILAVSTSELNKAIAAQNNSPVN